MVLVAWLYLFHLALNCTQIVGILIGTNCAPLVAYLFCYERDFMLSLPDNYQADIFEAFNSISRYLDGLPYIDNPYQTYIRGAF